MHMFGKVFHFQIVVLTWFNTVMKHILEMSGQTRFDVFMFLLSWMCASHFKSVVRMVWTVRLTCIWLIGVILVDKHKNVGLKLWRTYYVQATSAFIKETQVLWSWAASEHVKQVKGKVVCVCIYCCIMLHTYRGRSISPISLLTL